MPDSEVTRLEVCAENAFYKPCMMTERIRSNFFPLFHIKSPLMSCLGGPAMRPVRFSLHFYNET